MFLVQDEHGTTLVTQACVPKHFSACLPERERSQTDAINIDELEFERHKTYFLNL